MPRVERTNPDGVDYGWVMQTTFVVTILVGSPTVAALSIAYELPTWAARASFAIRVGAVIWILTAISAFIYAKRTDAGDGGTPPEADIEMDD
ncbi:peptidoglycan-binding protein [Halogeometricum borinquense]|uniref:Peptidoglycan-binding protein n=2 Tax=Halogeometricum borinquense TaxID=60847 RepID=E4NQR2_HALBP|nr:DUF5822 domain-containing protein [Halogeometricum borinquense]ADQ66750.1 hypothetical protein Hbor_11600 [Halogeometricum borinquense DSM 11551]ELY30259.1 hypothetical protein C499_03298 [Halogeometricum borinquense DSM 11551]QIB74927.1 peptidoglycan-binding protein [Halogeometricum borinquense]QIQ76073.1 peptidoglycan-binding protein [Halogeometricum borinquense]RYJ14588.1 peptidoglycan-binding protein [Halogeometricum borinquense]